MAGLETIRLRLDGLRPLLMNSGSMADPLHPAARELARACAKGFKTSFDHEYIAKLEFMGGLWMSEAGFVCVPSEVIEGTVVAAAKTLRRGPVARAGFFAPESPRLLYDGPEDPEGLWADPSFRMRHPVCVRGSRTIRTRARFAAWAIEFEAQFAPTLLTREDVVDLFVIAGYRCGIGDWRPKFGRFVMSVLD